MAARLPGLPLVLGLAGLAGLGAAPCRAVSWVQDGQASYYANHWNGHRTSSGARFDQEKLTCAHPTAPLGTKLLVTSEVTGDSVVVTVNDRQPPHGDRIIDLSRAAARRLHMLGAGVADVEISRATPREIDAENANEVADAPDEAVDQEVATPRTDRLVTRARRGPRRTHHVRP